MRKFIECLVCILFSVLGVLHFANGIKCYSCLDYNSEAVPPTKILSTTVQDISCAWGSVPDDRFLQECPPINATEAGSVAEACMTTQVIGILVAGGNQVNATVRQCHIRRIGQITEYQEPKNRSSTNAFLAYGQGPLAEVAEIFKDASGREFLKGISVIFNDTVSFVRIIVCDLHACKEPEEELVTDSTTCQNSGSTDTTSRETTENSGASTVAARARLFYTNSGRCFILLHALKIVIYLIYVI